MVFARLVTYLVFSSYRNSVLESFASILFVYGRNKHYTILEIENGIENETYSCLSSINYFFNNNLLSVYA